MLSFWVNCKIPVYQVALYLILNANDKIFNSNLHRKICSWLASVLDREFKFVAFSRLVILLNGSLSLIISKLINECRLMPELKS